MKVKCYPGGRIRLKLNVSVPNLSGNSSPAFGGPARAQMATSVPDSTVFSAFDEFVSSYGSKHSWTPSTIAKMDSLRRDLLSFDERLTFAGLSEKTLTDFVRFLRDDKILYSPRTPRRERIWYDRNDFAGIKNSTIGKKLGALNCFLNWAAAHGYNPNPDYKSFRPSLKTSRKTVIYLTAPELKRLHELEFTPRDEYLRPVRDIFLFCCFSGLRYSDAIALKWAEVKRSRIEVTTIKTADSIIIEINDVMREILGRYNRRGGSTARVFPQISNQAMNLDLKKLCRLASINESVRVTTYRGNERTDAVIPKYKLIGTHTGRRTFVVNALSRGIPPCIVMKWTGHSDYKSMKPYIDIVDRARARQMSKMNFLSKAK